MDKQNQIIELLQNLLFELKRLNCSNIEEVNIISKRQATKLAKIHPNTLANWSKEATGLKVGRNQYDAKVLKQIIKSKSN